MKISLNNYKGNFPVLLKEDRITYFLDVPWSVPELPEDRFSFILWSDNEEKIGSLVQISRVVKTVEILDWVV